MPADDQPPACDLGESLLAEVRLIAQRQLGRERPGHSLQASAVVNEAWIRLAGQRNVDPARRAHFLAAAATTIRRVLIDHARRNRADRRGGGFFQIPLHGSQLPDANQPQDAALDLIALDEALDELRGLNARCCRVVEMKFFAGLTAGEIAPELGVSPRTVDNDWAFARSWLLKRLAD